MATKPRKVNHTINEVYELMHDYILTHESQWETLDKVNKEVNGNGSPGLKQDMALVQEREIKRDRREWFVFTVLVAQVIAIIVLKV